jgi:hypothetical protein
MSKRQLAAQVALALAVLAAANAAVAWLARNSVPRQVLRRGASSPPATDLFLGNSTMAAGLDESAFAAILPGRPLNLGMSGSPVEHLLIYRQQGRHRGARVYYGAFDTQLTDPPSGGWGDLIGNRAMAYYVEPEVSIRYYAPREPVRALLHRLAGRFPALAERAALWVKVENLRRALGELGMPKKAVNRFGRAEDFALLEGDLSGFRARCAEAVARDAPLSGPVRELFALARDAGGGLYVVEMPMPSRHRRRYYATPEWPAYRAHVEALVARAGGVVVPASDWVGDDGFIDALHLNAEGARAFSRRLARWVAGSRRGGGAGGGPT